MTVTRLEPQSGHLSRLSKGFGDWPAWLGETPSTSDQSKAMLRPFPAYRMAMGPVDKSIGNEKNEGREHAEWIAA